MDFDKNIKVAMLDNGLTVVGEQMSNVASGAFSILVPIGSAYDDANILGASNVLAEMFNKGGGKYEKKKLSDELEAIGLQNSHTAGTETSTYSGALFGENLEKIFHIYSEILLTPHLNENDLTNVKELTLQELKYIEDNPLSKARREFLKNFYPGVFGRPTSGTEEGIKNLSTANLLSFYKQNFLPSNSIIAVAGKFDWEKIVQTIKTCFSSWTGQKPLLFPEPLSKTDKNIHIQQDASQLQIFLGYPGVAIDHPDNYVAAVAVGILSGGMHGRLFVEVREKRGLVYSVSASRSAQKGRAATIIYAGTTPEKGQETLDVILNELHKLQDGVTEEELQRAKADIKSKLILSSESSYNRANSMVSDFWNFGKVRTIESIKQGIDAVTNEDLKRHLREYPVMAKILVTLGNAKLKL
ncbi:MAG: insulinase family protein [Deltaproteobacteria bacterium]|jgi:predicted Zn-dependent peptidase|nr:insulinase family protein [Deltaproteobacteria bacterium]